MKEKWRNMKEYDGNMKKYEEIFTNFPSTWRGMRSMEKVLWVSIQRYLSPDWGEGGSKDTFPQIVQNGPFPRWRTFYRIGEGDPDPRKRSYGSPSKDTFPWDFRAFQQEGGNLTRTQFLRWPPVPKGKAGSPPKYAENMKWGVGRESLEFFKSQSQDIWKNTIEIWRKYERNMKEIWRKCSSIHDPWDFETNTTTFSSLCAYLFNKVPP